MISRLAVNSRTSRTGAAIALTILLAAHDAAVAQISLPFKLPPDANNLLKELQPDALKQQAAELALRNLLNNELPLRLDATTVYPTVAVLPGGPFQPRPLSLSAADVDRPLPPGDYTIPALVFCTEYSVHQPGRGTAYVLAPLQGKAAQAISTLLWRGSVEMHKPAPQLQTVSWAIQSGLAYPQMPPTYQAIIDAVIPEYKGQISGNFLKQLQDTYQTAAKGTRLPPLEKLLGDMGQSGQLALSAMRQQQILLNKDTTDQLREQTLFRGQESGIYTPVKAEEGPWTERIPHVAYERFQVISGNLASDNVLQVRILPTNGPRTARQRGTEGFVQVGYGTQPVQAYSQPATIREITSNALGQPEGHGSQSLVVTPAVKAAPPPCKCTTPNVVGPQLVPDNQPATWIQHQGYAAAVPGGNVYTDYCAGQTMDGIMFVPNLKGLTGNANVPYCPQENTHIRQFVNTACPSCAPAKTTYSIGCPSGVVARKFGEWYLDECPSAQYNATSAHLTPDGLVGGTDVISDEPTPNLTDGSDTPLVKTFHDVVMCGEDHVIGAYTWIRTGEPHPQWCTNPTNGQLKTVSGGEYNQPRSEGLGTLNNVVCNIGNAPAYNDPGLSAIRSSVGGCPPKP